MKKKKMFALFTYNVMNISSRGNILPWSCTTVTLHGDKIQRLLYTCHWDFMPAKFMAPPGICLDFQTAQRKMKIKLTSRLIARLSLIGEIKASAVKLIYLCNGGSLEKLWPSVRG